MAATNVQAFSGDVDIAGTATVTNLVRGVAEEAVRWNSQSETVFPQSDTTRYYKLATLGTTGDGANGGKLRISGTIGGFIESTTTLIDAFVASRSGIIFGGTLSGYGGDGTIATDIVVYLESDGTFAVWLKLLRYYTFDFTIMGAQVSNNTRQLAVLPCPTTDTSVATPTGTLQGSVVDSCSIVFNDDGTINSTGGVDNLTLAEDSTDTSRRVLFSTGSTGAQSVKTDGGLVYNPANNILTTTVSSAQTATNANKLFTNSVDTTNANYYVPFRSGHSNDNGTFSTDENLYYNPANNTLNVNANSATFANGATFANNATNATFASGATNAAFATNATFANSATNATFANGATFANNATNAGHATNSASASKLFTNSVDSTNANYHIPFRAGHDDNSVDFYTDANLYYNAANNYINANTPYASTSGNTSGNANYANSSGYANSAGSAYSTNGGFINGGIHRANTQYELRNGGYQHFIQMNSNNMLITAYGDIAQYGGLIVSCGDGPYTTYNCTEFFNKGTNINGHGGIRVNGPCRANNFPGNSDDRIKYNETTLTNCLSIIGALRPLKYEKLNTSGEYGTWIPTNEEWETDKANGEHWSYEMGFVAQEVREIPELAFTVGGEEIVNKERTITIEDFNLLNSNLQIGYTPIYSYLREIIITNAEYKDLDVDESQNYSIHEVEGYVSGDVTKTIEEFEQLTSEEQSGYKPFYSYRKNGRIEVDDYNALSSEERSQYSNTLSGYSNVIPTQVPLTVDYNSIFTTAVGAIQELTERVITLETRVTNLEGN